MKLLVDALSVTNLSGRHVFLGHMTRLARWTEGTHEFVVLRHGANADLEDHFDAGVRWIECPRSTASWRGRTLWERTRLPGLVGEVGAGGVISFAGIPVGALPVPQMTFASNPWCLVPEVHRGFGERVKAGLQRRAYADASRGGVDTIVFASDYLRRAYLENAGAAPTRTAVVYPGIDDATFAAAGSVRDPGERDEATVVTVSAMAPHKNVETVIRALSVLRGRGVPARLDLVGGWPDPGYEHAMRGLIAEEGVAEHVRIFGYVADDELLGHYGRARAFCLMSRCESFGIPAVEAQAFGTPVVSSDCCAVPEVCGEGGTYLPPGDAHGVAAELEPLLLDAEHWRRRSEAARRNAERFRWDRCSRPLVELLDHTFGGGARDAE